MFHTHKEKPSLSENALVLSLMALSFQMMYILVSVAAVIAILARTSGLDASSETIAQRYLNFFTVSSFFPLAVMFCCIPLLLFVINFVLLH